MKAFLLAVLFAAVFATKECGKNETLQSCGTACEPKCDEPFPVFCTKQCLLNVCQCARNYKRGPNGCVLDQDCPHPTECDEENAERKNGADPNCEVNCEDIKSGNTNKICNRMLYLNRCYCKSGYLPLKTGGKCIKKEECPN